MNLYLISPFLNLYGSIKFNVLLKATLFQDRLAHLTLKNHQKFVFNNFIMKFISECSYFTFFQFPKFHSIWVTRAQVMSSSSRLPCFHLNRAWINFKELLGEIYLWFDLMDVLLCFNFLTKLVSLKLRLFRASYAPHITLWLGQKVNSNSHLLKITTDSL